jgi:hypothetical protein
MMMSGDKDSIDPEAMDTMSIAPNDPGETRRDAGEDDSIRERLERNPHSKEARLDRALDESMDASDPPASTQPIHNHGPAPSSGYDAEAERKLAEGGQG